MSRTGLVYRTPGDVRAISNAQWETWLRDEQVPWPAFSADAQTQMALRYVVKASGRRIAALDR